MIFVISGFKTFLVLVKREARIQSDKTQSSTEKMEMIYEEGFQELEWYVISVIHSVNS